MTLATTLMGVGIPAEPATRLGYSEQVPLDGVGTVQAGAAEILRFNTNIACGTSAGETAFILPSDAELMQPYFVLNTTPEAALIYPPVGDTIDEGAVNAAVSIELDFARVFQRVEDGRWVSWQTGFDALVVQSIVAGTGIAVDNTDPENPVISNTGVLSVVAGTNVTVDDTDPQNPIINSSNPGGTVTSVGLAAPTGFDVSGSPVTVSGTLTLSYSTGYQGFTTAEAGLIATALQPSDIGVTVQAYSSNLDDWATVNPSAYLNAAQIAAAYQPLSSNLTSWAGVTRAGGFDSFAATVVIPATATTAAIQSAIDSVSSGDPVRVKLLGVAYDLSGGNVIENGRIVSWDIDPRATFTGGGTLPAFGAPNYGGHSIKQTQLYLKRGGSSSPVSADGASTALFELNSSYTGTGVQNAAMSAYGAKWTDADGSRVQAAFFEAVDYAGWDGTGDQNFVEGIRSHGILDSAATLGSAYGAISFAGMGTSVQFTYILGHESDVKNEYADAPVPASFSTDSFIGSYLASNSGTNKSDFGFATNVFSASPYRSGFMVMSGSVDHSAFVNKAAVSYGLNLNEGSYSVAAIALPYNNRISWTFGGAEVGYFGFGQLQFPATQNPSANANTLDDYEEGTFTPAFAATGATYSYASRAGHYTKIGNLVWFSAEITLNTSGNTLGTAALSMTGLPFASKTGGPGAVLFPVMYNGSTTAMIIVQAVLTSSASSLTFTHTTAAGTSNVTNPTNSNNLLHATNGTTVRVSGCYISD